MGKSFISLATNGQKDFTNIFKKICEFPISESSNIQIWKNPKTIKNICDIEIGEDNNNIIVRFNHGMDFIVFESKNNTKLIKEVF